MKILIDARPIVDANGGGISRVALALVAAYAETFSDDELVCVTTGWHRSTLPDVLRAYSNVTHRHIRIPNKLWGILTVLGFSLHQWATTRVWTITRIAPTVVNAIFLPNIGFIGKLPRHIPTVLLLHDLSFLIEPRWFTWKQRLWHDAVHAKRLIQSAAHILAVSETTKHDAIRLLGIAPERITVIPIGQTLSIASLRAPADHTHQSDSRRVLVLGAEDPRKNAATARAAVRVLRAEQGAKDLKLVEVGKDTRISDDELAELYANASALLYPSWYEGYGLPLHEAAAFGTPLIASTAGALPETAPHGTLFADPAKPHQWVEAVRIALSCSRQTPITPDETAWHRAAEILRRIYVNILAQ